MPLISYMSVPVYDKNGNVIYNRINLNEESDTKNICTKSIYSMIDNKNEKNEGICASQEIDEKLQNTIKKSCLIC